jgi:hypothetical protein
MGGGWVKDRLGFLRVVSMFLSPATGRQCQDCIYVWPEYINFVGPAAVLCFVAAAFLARRHALFRRPLLLSALATALMVGDWGAYSPYVLLHHLPPYDSLRVPARWGVLVSLQMAVLVGLVLHHFWPRLQGRLTAKQARLAWVGAAAVLWLPPFLVNQWLWQPGFKERPPQVTAGPFRQERGGAWNAWLDTRRNVGTVDCYENVQVQRAQGLWFGAGEQVRVVQGQGSARLAEFTPNVWTVEVSAQTPSLVLLNMNHHRAWSLRHAVRARW